MDHTRNAKDVNMKEYEVRFQIIEGYVLTVEATSPEDAKQRVLGMSCKRIRKEGSETYWGMDYFEVDGETI